MRIYLAKTSQVNALFCVLNDCFEVFLKYVPLELLNKMAAVFECSLSDLIEEDSRYSHKKKGRKTSQFQSFGRSSRRVGMFIHRIELP